MHKNKTSLEKPNIIIYLLLLLIGTTVDATTFTVTSIADTETGSLRNECPVRTLIGDHDRGCRTGFRVNDFNVYMTPDGLDSNGRPTWQNRANGNFNERIAFGMFGVARYEVHSDQCLPATGAGCFFYNGIQHDLFLNDFSNWRTYSGIPRLQAILLDNCNQTITFNELSDKTYGDVDFDVSACVDSGLEANFSSQTSTICSVSSDTGTVSLLGSGECTIRAWHGGGGTQ